MTDPETAPYDPSRPDGINPSATEVLGPGGRIVPGVVHTIPARQGRAVRLKAGERIRVITPSGSQVCDFFAVIDGAPAEYLSMEHCHTALGGVMVHEGDTLVTNRRRAILTITEDTSPGVHDTVVAACDHTRYRELGCTEYHDNCADNLRMALNAVGQPAHLVPAPLNLFMNVPLDDRGCFIWTAPVAAPGDAITFEAHLDCIAILSACPQDVTAVNGDTPPGPLEVELLP